MPGSFIKFISLYLLLALGFAMTPSRSAAVDHENPTKMTFVIGDQPPNVRDAKREEVYLTIRSDKIVNNSYLEPASSVPSPAANEVTGVPVGNALEAMTNPFSQNTVLDALKTLKRQALGKTVLNLDSIVGTMELFQATGAAINETNKNLFWANPFVGAGSEAVTETAQYWVVRHRMFLEENDGTIADGRGRVREAIDGHQDAILNALNRIQEIQEEINEIQTEKTKRAEERTSKIIHAVNQHLKTRLIAEAKKLETPAAPNPAAETAAQADEEKKKKLEAVQTAIQAVQTAITALNDLQSQATTVQDATDRSAIQTVLGAFIPKKSALDAAIQGLITAIAGLPKETTCPTIQEWLGQASDAESQNSVYGIQKKLGTMIQTLNDLHAAFPGLTSESPPNPTAAPASTPVSPTPSPTPAPNSVTPPDPQRQGTCKESSSTEFSDLQTQTNGLPQNSSTAVGEQLQALEKEAKKRVSAKEKSEEEQKSKEMKIFECAKTLYQLATAPATADTLTTNLSSAVSINSETLTHPETLIRTLQDAGITLEDKDLLLSAIRDLSASLEADQADDARIRQLTDGRAARRRSTPTGQTAASGAEPAGSSVREQREIIAKTERAIRDLLSKWIDFEIRVGHGLSNRSIYGENDTSSEEPRLMNNLFNNTRESDGLYNPYNPYSRDYYNRQGNLNSNNNSPHAN